MTNKSEYFYKKERAGEFIYVTGGFSKEKLENTDSIVGGYYNVFKNAKDIEIFKSVESHVKKWHEQKFNNGLKIVEVFRVN